MAKTILYFDAFDTLNAELIKDLKSLDISVNQVRNEFNALSMLTQQNDKISIIIWNLKDKYNDFEIIKKIKDKTEFKDLPLVILSRFSEKDCIIRALQCGAIEYIISPFAKDIFLKKICKILNIEFSMQSLSTLNPNDTITFDFISMLKKEIKSAQRGKYALSLMLISLINNDGSQPSIFLKSDILSLFKKIIKLKLRDTDTIFTYKDNRLIAILPFTDSNGAKKVESNLNTFFKNSSTVASKSQTLELVLAHVSYPAHAKIIDNLIIMLEQNFKYTLNARITSLKENIQ